MRNYLRFGGSGKTRIVGDYCKVLNAAPGTAVITHDVVLKRASAAPVKFVDADDKPVVGALVKGLSPDHSAPTKRIASDSSTVYQLSLRSPRRLAAYEPTCRLFGALDLKGNETGPLVVRLGPLGVATGRAITDDGTSLKGLRLRLVYADLDSSFVDACDATTPPVKTDAAGAFRTEYVLPGRKVLAMFLGNEGYYIPTPEPPPAVLTDVSKPLDLGDIRVKPAR